MPPLAAYALTETASSCSVDYPGAQDWRSAGRVFENLSVKIRHADPDGIGEICIKGDAVFLGYYGDPQRSKAAFDEDGYFCTGDLGYVDEGLRLYISGRKNRAFSTAAGEIVQLEEIELLFRNLPAVYAAKVYLQDGDLAAAVCLNDTTASLADCMACINAKLPSYAHVKQYALATQQQADSWK